MSSHHWLLGYRAPEDEYGKVHHRCRSMDWWLQRVAHHVCTVQPHLAAVAVSSVAVMLTSAARLSRHGTC